MIHREGRPTAFVATAASHEGVHRLTRVFDPGGIAAFPGSRPRGTTALGRRAGRTGRAEML
ncbi:hypothetical protein SUDANB176_00467 [Streptomyces sp. enrichment culture]|uniref:hypothetical protein n=1 Tax=Streptomyces sp. enrichment culture TaxID=1795815 RepID=UPI003F55E552